VSSESTGGGPAGSTQGPFVVSEYVALPGDRVHFAAIDHATLITCAGRELRELAKQDADALNAAWRLGREYRERNLRPRVEELKAELDKKGVERE
jgi:hypothetical protein